MRINSKSYSWAPPCFDYNNYRELFFHQFLVFIYFSDILHMMIG